MSHFKEILVLSMGALDEGHLDAELENGVKLGFLDLVLGVDSETAVIEDAVKILLQGLGEDPNREGLRRTPLRVAKALREGTTGEYKYIYIYIYRFLLLSILFMIASLSYGSFGFNCLFVHICFLFLLCLHGKCIS